MIITLAGFKGGVGKTTTAIHLAGLLHRRGKTLLVDGDPNRSAMRWAQRGQLPFLVVTENQAPKRMREHEHIVIDTPARPSMEELKDLSEGCDLLILPTTPDALALDALLMTIATLQQLATERYKVLLTVVPPYPSQAGTEAQETLKRQKIPVFEQVIRRYVAFQKAGLEGCLVCDVADGNAVNAWWDYQQLMKEIGL
jgi:chromosome partitioning protein